MSTDIDRLEAELIELRQTPTPTISPYVEAFARIVEQSEALRESLRRAEINIEVRDQAEAIASLAEMFGRLVEALQAKEMSVTVNVPPVQLIDDNHGPLVVTFTRNPNGSIKSARIAEEGA